MDTKYIEKNTDIKVEYYEEIGSTNDRAKEIAEKVYNDIEKRSNRTNLIIAESQTKGRGTNGRSWLSQKGENILMTLLFYPQNTITELEGITYKIAEMIKIAIKDLYNIDLSIKLPNDLLLNNKKICGILTESSISNDKVNYLIIGIGFDVNQIEFDAEISEIATSLKKEHPNIAFNREDIIIKVANNIKSLFR